MTTTTLRTPTWSRIRFGILILYTVTMMLLLGGLLVETFMVYPQHLSQRAGALPDRAAVHVDHWACTVLPAIRHG